MTEKFFSRTPKYYLLRSWAHNPEDSKIDPLVRTHECQAHREPSLVVSRGHISWLMLSLLALTRQKQLAKSSPQARHVSSKTAFLDEMSITSILPRGSQIFLWWARNGTARNKLQKKLLYRRLPTPLEACPQRTLLSNESKGMVLPFAWNAIGQDILANFIAK